MCGFVWSDTCSTWVYGVHRTCAKTTTVSHGTSHVTSKQTSFYLLPDLCHLHFSCCLEQVEEKKHDPQWGKKCDKNYQWFNIDFIGCQHHWHVFQALFFTFCALFHVSVSSKYSQKTRSSQFYVQSSDPEVILCGWQDIEIKNWLSSLYHILSINSIIKESSAHLSVRFRLAFLLFGFSLRLLVAHWCSKVHLHKHDPTSEHSNIHSGLLNTGAAKSTFINTIQHLNIHSGLLNTGAAKSTFINTIQHLNIHSGLLNTGAAKSTFINTIQHLNIHSGLLNTGAAKSTCINPTKHLSIHMFTLVSWTLVPQRPPVHTPPNTWTFTHSLLSPKDCKCKVHLHTTHCWCWQHLNSHIRDPSLVS